MGTFVSVSLKIPYKKLPDGEGRIRLLCRDSSQHCAANQKCSSLERFEAIIDSGATRCVFHADIGKAIGLDVEAGEIESTLGIAGSTNMYLHDISLYAPGGIIAIRAGFSIDLPVAGLLGMTGFFDNFKITFDAIGRHCELERLFRA